MNVDNSTLRDLQCVLDSLEMNHRINQKLAQQNAENEYLGKQAWGIEFANSSYSEYLKQLRSVVERMGKGNLYLIDDVRLDGGEDHATA